MAIPNSPDWSLTPINHKKGSWISIPSPFFSEPSKIYPFFPLCFSSRAFVAKSLTCSSVQVLEDASFSSNSSAPLIQLGLKLEDVDHLSNLADGKDFNGIICALFEDPRTAELAYDYYQKAKEVLDFRPTKLSLKLVTRYLINSRNWDLLSSLFKDFRTFQVLPDGSTCFRLMSCCIRARKFKLAHNILQICSDDEKIAVLAFDAAMKEYNKLHMYSSSIALFEQTKSNGIALNSGCYCHIMDAYVKVGKYESMLLVFEEFEQKEIGSNRFIHRIYWMLCESLGKTGRPFEALKYFREFTSKGFKENNLFYSSLISSFISIREVKVAEELLEEAESKKMVRDPALFLKLVLMYIQEGLLERTLDVVGSMKSVKIRVSDCISCTIVNGFSRRRGLNAAVEAYENLLMQNCEPGQVTYASVLNIYCKLGLYSKAEMIFAEMEEKGFHKCVVAYSSMVAMYGKIGRVGDAMKLVAKMKERGCKPNVWIYNILLDIHGRSLNVRQVQKVWKEMKRSKVSPDRISYTSIISSYNKSGDFESCVRYFHEFRYNGGTIDKAMAGIMVSVLSKMNRIDELVMLLQDMKAEGTKIDLRLYKSALNALKDSGLHVQAKWLQESFGQPKLSG